MADSSDDDSNGLFFNKTIDDEDGGNTCRQQSERDCLHPLLLPSWMLPDDVNRLTSTAQVFHAVCYLLALAYLIFGVAIVTEHLIIAIEVIVSRKISKVVDTKSGISRKVDLPFWHPTVASLTVFAIGASSAEILLPTCKIVMANFQVYDVGPSLVISGGAYRLFFITSVCLFSASEANGKAISDLGVFFVNCGFSLFAYVWLVILLKITTPGEVTLYEALLTLAIYPVLVVTAWSAERRLCCSKKKPQVIDGGEYVSPEILEALAEQDQHRAQVATLLRETKANNPGKSDLEIEEVVEVKLLKSLPKNVAYYRIQAAKNISGSGPVISKEVVMRQIEYDQRTYVEPSIIVEESQMMADNMMVQTVGFDRPNYNCLENTPLFTLPATRCGAGVATTRTIVRYNVVEGAAIAQPSSGDVEFAPGVQSVNIGFTVLSNQTGSFKVVLSDARFKDQHNHIGIVTAKLVYLYSEVMVTIFSVNQAGVFEFETASVKVPSDIGKVEVKVKRLHGARGHVTVPFVVTADSAKEGQDYIIPPSNNNGHISFKDAQFEESIEIKIVNTKRIIGEEKKLFIDLKEPLIFTATEPTQTNTLADDETGSHVGKVSRATISICESAETTATIDQLVRLSDISELFSYITWRDQFREVFTVNVSDSNGDGDGDSENNDVPSQRVCLKKFHIYLTYALSLPWKLLLAFVPPVSYFRGWLAFVFLFCLMGVVSALIGDVAMAFGCTVRLKDAVTVILLVSPGLALPDTFACRQAAIHEKTADAALNHITGANAVNFFLGVGIALTVGAGYHTYHGSSFKVPHSNVAYIVTVFVALAIATISILVMRRLPPIRGELGGPQVVRLATAILFAIFWVAFILLLSLQVYCFIESF